MNIIAGEEGDLREWNLATSRIYNAVDRALREPTFCAGFDLKPQAGESDYVTALRAIAATMMPPRFGWTVTYAFGGRAYLTLQGISPA